MTMLPKEMETIQQEINNKQKNLDIINEFHKQSAMNSFNIIAIITLCLSLLGYAAFSLKAILEKDAAFIKEITIYETLGIIIWIMVYMCVQITLFQTAFSPERMRRAIRNINKKMNYDSNKDNIQQFFENKGVDFFVLKQLKNILNNDKIITYGIIYDLKCQLELDIRKLKEKVCEIQKTQAEQQDLAKKSILDKQKQELEKMDRIGYE